MTTDDLEEVRLLGLPVALHVAARRHQDALRRELELIRLRDADDTSVPNRLHTLVDELVAEYGSVVERPVAILDDAIARAADTVDLIVRAPRSAADAARRLATMLDEVDDYCRSTGYLLTLVTPPEVAAYRAWTLHEFAAQLDGAPPRPWPGSATPAVPAGEPASERDLPSLAVGEVALGSTGEVVVVGSTVRVDGSLDLESAPALRDALVALLQPGGTVTVDLAACSFVDSVGVSVLVAGLARAGAAGASLAVRLGPAARDVLVVSGLIDRFDIVDD